MTDGSRDATLGFSREATSEISQGTRVPWNASPQIQIRPGGTTEIATMSFQFPHANPPSLQDGQTLPGHPQALAYLANFRCPSGTTGQRDNPTRRPMTDGSRDATLGFSREATLDISQGTRVPGTRPPQIQIRPGGTTMSFNNFRTRIHRPSRTDKLFLDIPRHWRTWRISDVPPGQRDNGTTQHVAP